MEQRRSDGTDVDALVAKELFELSANDRLRAIQELHGVEPILHEDVSTLPMLFEAMVKEIQRLQYQDRKEYNQAKFLDPSLACDQQLHIAFLRSTRYRPAQAAAKMAAYFKAKMGVFGLGSIAKEIVSLDEAEDRELLASGQVQMTTTDITGRPILFVLLQEENNVEYDNDGNRTAFGRSLTRVVWYTIMSRLRRGEQLQKSGIVIVVYFVSSTSEPSDEPTTEPIPQESGPVTTGDNHSKRIDLWQLLPIRIAGFHFCCISNDSSVRAQMDRVRMDIGMAGRVRFRSHQGSVQHLKSSLLAFGIQPHSIPIDDDGTIHPPSFRSSHQVAFAAHNDRNTIPQQANSQHDVQPAAASLPFLSLPTSQISDTQRIHPTELDCLLGRGRPYQSFVGNRRLSEAVGPHRQRYRSAMTRKEKKEIVDEVIHQVQNVNGGRFLRRTSNGAGWEEASESEIRNKVGQTFRAQGKRDKSGSGSGSGSDDSGSSK